MPARTMGEKLCTMDSELMEQQPLLPDDAAPLKPIRQAKNIVRWYVMRVSYNREQKVADYLSGLGYECYVPKKTQITYNEEGDRLARVVDVLPNILFVRASWHQLYELKDTIPSDYPLLYLLDHTKAGTPPMFIPDKMMNDFIEQTTERPESLLWLDHPADVFTKGKRVRVTCGPLAGYEGYVLRIKRNRRFVLSLNGLVSAAVMSADCRHDWLEPLD